MPRITMPWITLPWITLPRISLPWITLRGPSRACRSAPPSRAVVVAVSATAVALLTACGSPSESGDMTPPDTPASPTADATATGPLPQADVMELHPGAAGRGLPAGVEGDPGASAGAAWAPDEGLLYVVTYGSSSCPRLAEPDAARAGDVLRVRLVPLDEDRACTADLAPTTSVVGVPDGADTGHPVTVSVGDLGSVTIQPRPVVGEPGPVAWIPVG